MKTFRLYALLILIILLGFALRLYRLDAVPLRGDEAFSVERWTASPLNISLREIASLEPHPPLTYVIFRAWGLLFGVESVFALRMFPLLINLLGIPALFALGKCLTGKAEIALFAAFFWAVHPFQIWHAQDFRNYAIWAGLSTIVLYFGLRIIFGKHDKQTWFIYGVLASISCLIFYNELLTIGVLGLIALLFSRDWRFLWRWSLLNLGIISLTIAAFIVFQGNLLTSGGYAGTTGGFELEQLWQRFLPVLTLGDTLSLSLRQQFSPYTEWWSLVVVILAFSWGLIFRKNHKLALILLIIGIVPLLVLGLVSTRLYIFRPRYVLMVAPAYTLILACTMWILWNLRFAKIFAAILCLGYLVFIGYSLNNYYHDAAFRKAPAWDALAAYLAHNSSTDETIIQTSVDPAFAYYYRLAAIEAGEFALPANFDQPILEIISTMEATAENYHSIWIVGQTFPDWQNAGVVEDWASVNLQTVRETELAGLPVRQFMNWDVLDSEIVSEPLASYANFANLVGVRTFTQEPTNELYLWLYWQALSQTEEALKVFVHLVGNTNPNPSSPLWSQDDQEPQEGRIQTSTWEINTVYRDVFVLPLEGVIAGDYSLLLGFYNPNTNERVLLPDGSDTFNLGSIRIEEGD